MPIYLLYSYKTFNKNYVIIAENLSYNKGKNVKTYGNMILNI
jgi:hypothetical protein